MKFAFNLSLWLQSTTIAKAFAVPLSHIVHAPLYPLCDVL